MSNPRLTQSDPLESPALDVCVSRFHDLQLGPARFYQATWDTSPTNDILQPWDGLLAWSVDSSLWTGVSLTNQTLHFIDLTHQEDAEDRMFDIIDAAGAVVDTATISIPRRTWLLRFRQWEAFGDDRSLRIDHWYHLPSSWTPAGTYDLLLQASPNQPFPDPIRFVNPITLTPTTI